MALCSAPTGKGECRTDTQNVTNITMTPKEGVEAGSGGHVTDKGALTVSRVTVAEED